MVLELPEGQCESLILLDVFLCNSSHVHLCQNILVCVVHQVIKPSLCRSWTQVCFDTAKCWEKSFSWCCSDWDREKQFQQFVHFWLKLFGHRDGIHCFTYIPYWCFSALVWILDVFMVSGDMLNCESRLSKLNSRAVRLMRLCETPPAALTCTVAVGSLAWSRRRAANRGLAGRQSPWWRWTLRVCCRGHSGSWSSLLILFCLFIGKIK